MWAGSGTRDVLCCTVGYGRVLAVTVFCRCTRQPSTFFVSFPDNHEWGRSGIPLFPVGRERPVIICRLPDLKDTEQEPRQLPELSTTRSDSSPLNSNARRPLPSLTPFGSLGTRCPLVVRGVRDLSFINLGEVHLVKERIFDVRVPAS